MQSTSPDWTLWPYQIGCPVWACKEWTGIVYPRSASSSQYLNWYSRHFNVVEGNSTFYGLPSRDQFQRWCDESISGFEFSFKFPREISHDRELVDCERPLLEFLDRLAVLRERGRLGPTFLQLGPQFSGLRFDSLRAFLDRLPKEWPWAVEVRHQDWFDESNFEPRLDDLLHRLQIDRVLFDSRPLYSRTADDPIEKISQTRKPQSPYRDTVTHHRPMVRLIGRNQPDQVTEYWQAWSITICDWIDRGLRPCVFTHAPDDAVAPKLARMLHSMIQTEYASRHPAEPKIPDLPELPNPPRVIQPMLFE